jgi:N-acetylmuramoyl-L-alanine amidase
LRKKILTLIIMTLLLTLLEASYFYRNQIYDIYGYSKAALSYMGSTGQEVIDLQAKLYNWGYYKGIVDGDYGYETYKAVQLFQSKNGLTVDGITGPETLTALGLPSGKSDTAAASADVAGNDDVNLLAHLIYGEARGEPYEGQVAVGAVILNRTKDSRFPQTIAGVIYQPGAFDAVSDGQINLDPDTNALNAARDALNGWDPTYGCIYYYNPATATSSWIWSRPIILKIGHHNFAN